MKRAHAHIDPRDGGFLSRKLVLAFVIIQELVAMHLLSARWGALIPGLEILDGACVAIFATYCGANIGNKLSVGKMLASKPVEPVEPEPPQDPDQTS